MTAASINKTNRVKIQIRFNKTAMKMNKSKPLK